MLSSAEPTGPQQGKGACPHSFQITMDWGRERTLGWQEGNPYIRVLTGLSATAEAPAQLREMQGWAWASTVWGPCAEKWSLDTEQAP